MCTKSIHFALFVFLTLMLVGWADRESIATDKTLKETPKAKTETPPKKADKHRATVKVPRLNLRNKASADSRILGILEKGDLLEVISVTDEWLKVISPSKKVGWVYMLYVDTDIKAEKAPAVSSNEGVKTLQKPAKNKITEKNLGPDKSKPSKKPAEKPTQTQPQDLRKKLESVWSAYREAHRHGDKALYKKTCSAYRCGTLINTLAAVREELTPEDLIFFYDRMPDLATLKFVELKENGPTAGLIYVDENQNKPDPDLPPPKRFLFIKFVQEAWDWTVDGIHSTSMPKHQIDGSETQFNYALLPEELALDGKVRPAPKAVRKPKKRVVKGALDISSYGYKTKASINGFDQGKAENTDYSGAITGGLKKGVNKIEIVIAKSDKTESDLPPRISVQYVSNSGMQREAFTYEPEENFEGRHLFTFMIE